MGMGPVFRIGETLGMNISHHVNGRSLHEGTGTIRIVQPDKFVKHLDIDPLRTIQVLHGRNLTSTNNSNTDRVVSMGITFNTAREKSLPHIKSRHQHDSESCIESSYFSIRSGVCSSLLPDTSSKQRKTSTGTFNMNLGSRNGEQGPGTPGKVSISIDMRLHIMQGIANPSHHPLRERALNI